jgi:hypothetical protein
MLFGGKIRFVHSAAYTVMAGFALLSCTHAAPAISFGFMGIVYQQTDNAVIPYMSFFVMAADPDGPEDLDMLYLYHDGEGLNWKFDSESLIRYEEAGRVWLGSKSLRMPFGESFPSGQYRAVIADKSGEQGEKLLNFESPKERYKFPKLLIEDGNYLIVSDYPDNYLICYYSDGSYRSLFRADSKSGSVLSLRLTQDIYSMALWAEDKSNAVSALTNKVNVR